MPKERLVKIGSASKHLLLSKPQSRTSEETRSSKLSMR